MTVQQVGATAISQLGATLLLACQNRVLSQRRHLAGEQSMVVYLGKMRANVAGRKGRINQVAVCYHCVDYMQGLNACLGMSTQNAPLV